MTLSVEEWWQQIVAFTRAGDTNGLLVAADALTELGEEKDADGIRWAVRKELKFILCTSACWVSFVGLSSPSFSDNDSGYGIRNLWKWVIDRRSVLKEFFE